MADLSQAQLWVTVLGGLLIVFVYWYFLLRSFKGVRAKGSIDIVVSGGYNPEIITVPKNQTTRLNFYRTDSTSCLEEVIIEDFNIKKYLPLKQTVTIDIHPNKEGEIGFSCSMNMYHGKIRVV